MELQARINLERRIVRRVVRALLAAGYEITVNNGGDENEIPYSRKFSRIAGALFATDDEHLLVRKDAWHMEPDGLKPSFVYLVYGNDGWDVINDYGPSLEPIMAPISQYCDKLELIHS